MKATPFTLIRRRVVTPFHILLAFCVVASLAAPLPAQDAFTAGSGLWSMGQNWSLQRPPGQSDDCVIPTNSNVTDDLAGICNNYTMRSGTVVTVPANTPAYLEIYGPSFVNQGILNVDSVNGMGFFSSGTQTISGGGTINFAARGIATSFNTVLVNLDNSIHGASAIYANQFTNQKLIDANVPGSLLSG